MRQIHQKRRSQCSCFRCSQPGKVQVCAAFSDRTFFWCDGYAYAQ